MGLKFPCPAGSLPRPAGGLLFAMGNVLYDATLWRRWLLQLVRRLGVRTDYRGFFEAWERDYLDDVYRGRREFCEAMRAFLLSTGLLPAQVDELEAACQARRRMLDESARPLPGVRGALARLRAAGLALAVLANSEHRSAVLAEQLERFGLGNVFSAVLSSVDMGRTKPDPLCYRAALGAMKLPAEQVAFVGHDAAELAGAARVGMMTIAFNFGPHAAADVFIARFEELVDVVGRGAKYAAAG